MTDSHERKEILAVLKFLRCESGENKEAFPLCKQQTFRLALLVMNMTVTSHMATWLKQKQQKER